jgi:S-adenosylmethionine:tRNA ribosyltransferase-isomerase
MANTADFQLDSYRYHLPNELIAQEPLKSREQSKLLVYDRATGIKTHTTFAEFPKLFLPNSIHLVTNNTKVFKARLIGKRILSPSTLQNIDLPQLGGAVEFFCLQEPKQVESLWTAQGLMKASAKIEPEFRFLVGDSIGTVIERHDQQQSAPIYLVHFTSNPKIYGQVPLPPYIESRVLETDHDGLNQSYNTVYAKVTGSVAAPTAGRHFTHEILNQLKLDQQKLSEITLHVGLGTFSTVKTNDIRDHKMHSEKIAISDLSAKQILESLQQGTRLLAVGTTAARTLESLTDNQLGHECEFDSNLFVYPGYQWKRVSHLLTNFHLPESTLLMLVASFMGSREKTLELYQEAVSKK